MRNLRHAVQVTVFALLLVVQLGAQSNSSFFVHEVVESKFSMIKAVSNNSEVIFRPDRLQIFKDGTLQTSEYLVYDSANKVTPQGRDLLSSSVEKIPNPDMAEVLGEEYMTVKKYATVVYQDLYDGADLEVSFDKNGELVFDLINHEGYNATLTLKSFFGDEVVSNDKGYISIAGVNLKPRSGQLTPGNGSIQLQNNIQNKNRKGTSNVSFVMEIK